MKKILSILLLLFFVQLSAYAAENPQAMIVFDASGSMWGKINGKTKISIAKKALNNVVSDWDESVHLGLMAYGHRKKGDCNDIQTLTPIGKVNKKDIIAKVKQINPKGKTPISHAIKKAAEELRYTEEKATIILISDGNETCNADPCSTAKDLENKGIDFVAHVIGFDVDKQTDAQLKCIADSTGGEYFSAKNASSLNEAMETIVKKVQKAKPKLPEVKLLKNNLQITASEKEGGKWVDAKNWVYKIVDGEKENNYIHYCKSTKKKACLVEIPEGKYTLHTQYNKLKQDTTFEANSDKLTELQVVMGETGKTEITVTEKEGRKWVDAKHWIYKVVDGEKEKQYTEYCRSSKKKSCLAHIPVGNYSLHTQYNKLKKDTPFEIKSGELAKLPIVIGATGKAEITVTEKEGGKWVDAKHWIYKVVNGEKESQYTEYCRSSKKKPCLAQIPEGNYSLHTEYNKLKQNTPIEIKSGEIAKLQIIMGQTGSAEITASEKEGSKWVNARHWLYKIVDGNKDNNYTEFCKSSNKKPCSIKVPEGKYSLHSTYNDFKKDTLIEIGASETSKVHVTFAQFFIESKCSDMTSIISHEIYASSGRLVYEKKAKCSDRLKVPLENGDYTMESKIGNDVKESKFTLGGDNPNQITIDMRDNDEEASHKELIEADKQGSSPKTTTQVIPPTIQSKKKDSVKEEEKESKKEITQDEKIQAFKQSIIVSLPEIKNARDCFRKAKDLMEAKSCEAIEEKALAMAMDSMKKTTGMIIGSNTLVKHTEWTEEIKKTTVDKTSVDIKKMELSVICIKKGANSFSKLKSCIASGG